MELGVIRIVMSRTHKDTKQYEEGIRNLVNRFCCVGSVPSNYKRARRKIRRAKEKDALRTDKIVPLFKSEDEFNWW